VKSGEMQTHAAVCLTSFRRSVISIIIFRIRRLCGHDDVLVKPGGFSGLALIVAPMHYSQMK